MIKHPVRYALVNERGSLAFVCFTEKTEDAHSDSPNQANKMMKGRQKSSLWH